jgi:hypothetical protein
MQVSMVGGGQIGQLALVVRREGGAFGVQPVEIARQFRRVGRGIEVGQVPIRQIAQRCTPGLGCGIKDGVGRWAGKGRRMGTSVFWIVR